MNKLFCELKTDEEKAEFFLSGRGYETGVIAHSIQNDVAMAYHRCAQFKKENDELRAKIKVMEQQEPVAHVWRCDNGHMHGSCERELPISQPLYLAPGAQPAQKAVAYLDLGAGGYMDIGTDLNDEQLDGQTRTVRDVIAERRRQVETEEWTPEHDDEHGAGEMAAAAACYALNAAGCGCEVARNWPWDRSWWKPTTSRRDLVKAGALILAEIERLDRATAPKPEGE